MSWVKVDDAFPMHPKAIGLSDEAVALWLRGLCYSNMSRTDGVIPTAALPILSRARKPAKVAAELVEAKLWDVTANGWQVHDFAVYQATAETRARLTEEKSQRQKSWRERRNVDASTPSLETRRSDAVDGGVDPAPHPHPHPLPDQKRSSIAPSAATVPAPKVKRDPKPKPEAPPPHPRHGEVVAAYFESFERVRGTKPVFAALEGRHVKTLLEKLSGDADRAIALIRAAFDGDPFLARAATIETIARDPSKYLGSKAPQRSPPWKQPVQPMSDAWAPNTGTYEDLPEGHPDRF